jgi:hypothetical protein
MLSHVCQGGRIALAHVTSTKHRPRKLINVGAVSTVSGLVCHLVRTINRTPIVVGSHEGSYDSFLYRADTSSREGNLVFGLMFV